MGFGKGDAPNSKSRGSSPNAIVGTSSFGATGMRAAPRWRWIRVQRSLGLRIIHTRPRPAHHVHPPEIGVQPGRGLLQGVGETCGCMLIGTVRTIGRHSAHRWPT